MKQEMQLISRAGKTFYFATLWLSRQVRQFTALAYNFCRTVDDLADDSPQHPDRDTQLTEIETAIRTNNYSNQIALPILPLVERYPEIREPLALLVSACKEDTASLAIRDEHDLERYAHGVAGNVGLIMYPILGGTSPLGLSHAADLGIAMQYTNIARDVLEDLRRGRVYLPTSWLAGCNPQSIINPNTKDEKIVVNAVSNLLIAAKERYERGLSGLGFLARENRFAITVAARCYAEIGERVIRDGVLSRDRAVVPLSRKIIIACTSGIVAPAVQTALKARSPSPVPTSRL
jgi:phytoene synthase